MKRKNGRLQSVTMVRKVKLCTRSLYPQYTDKRHMTCQCLVIWGYLKRIIIFYSISIGLVSKETWQSGAKSATLASWW